MRSCRSVSPPLGARLAAQDPHGSLICRVRGSTMRGSLCSERDCSESCRRWQGKPAHRGVAAHSSSPCTQRLAASGTHRGCARACQLRASSCRSVVGSCLRPSEAHTTPGFSADTSINRVFSNRVSAGAAGQAADRVRPVAAIDALRVARQRLVSAWEFLPNPATPARSPCSISHHDESPAL